MTLRQVYEAVLIEISKVNAPALKLYEFNYLINKAIGQYVNKIYNIYETNQQTTDDLRVLKSTCFLTPDPISEFKNDYEIYFPIDYLHLLNCICIYKINYSKGCYNKDSYIEIPATKLTSDSLGLVLQDVYNRPSYKRPYYYIHNINTNDSFPTNPVKTDEGYYQNGTDMNGIYSVSNFEGIIQVEREPAGVIMEVIEESNFPRTFKLNIEGSESRQSLVEKPIAFRIGNPSKIRCEIRCGSKNDMFELQQVQIDYLKVPQYAKLTQEQIDLTQDTSQIMEFPDYVNQEIINELVHLIMERMNDPRLPNNMQITQSIARPTGQQQ